jgi:hypothetical protein
MSNSIPPLSPPPRDHSPDLTSSSPFENHTYNLTTEEPRYTDDTIPYESLVLTSNEVWFARRDWKIYMKKCADVARPELPSESVTWQFIDFFERDADEDLYDFFVAVQGDPSGPDLPLSLPVPCDCPSCHEFTLKDSGVAYAGKDRGEWIPEKHNMGPYEIPPWYLHVPGIAHCRGYVLEPKFSQSVVRALLCEHSYRDWMATEYECAVAGDALGIDAADVDLKLLGMEQCVGPDSITHRRFKYGGVTALPYREKECGMSEDCLVALEQYYIDLYEEDNQYSIDVCISYLVYSNTWTPAGLKKLAMAFGPHKAHAIVTQEQHIEWQVNSGELDIHLNDLVGYDIDLLALPINARAATYYSLDTDPQTFVANLVQVDISTISASDMRCPHCWSNFNEAEDEIIELKNGSVQTDNSPVKMPCPHGHLIGKTCLMQIVDAGDRLCPQCRSEIVRIVDPRRYHPAVSFHAFKDLPVKYSDWN